MATDEPDETATASQAPRPAGGTGAPDAERDHPATRLPVRDPERYQIIAEHARGGIGRVLRATDREFGRDVALKELLYLTPVAEMRFLREAVITSRLEHPNIVPVHEAGRWPDGRPYYAMKLVSGRPLRALIAEAHTFADRVALLGHVVAVADAMAYAHDRGVIHRDLKPANIIVGEYGETIVIDWGLAKYITDPDDQDRGEPAGHGLPELDLTRAGAVVGTPAYMAPEQAAGGVVSERSDVYALGAILRNVLGGALRPAPSPAPAGSTPDVTETGTAAALSAAGGSAEPPRTVATPPSDFEAQVPADLRAIVRHAMEAVPDARYPSAKAFGDDLRRWLAGRPVEAHQYSGRERAARWLATHRRLVQGAIGVLAVLLTGTILFLAREASLRTSAENARRAAETARVGADSARHVAESERDRADRTTVALLEQQGGTELASGHPFRAAPFLAEAYRRDPGNKRVRWLLTDALRAVDSLGVVFEAIPSAPGTDLTERYTYSIAFSADDSDLLTGQNQTIGVWDAKSGALRWRLALPWFSAMVRQSTDGKQLLVMADEAGNSPARLLDARDGRELAAVPVGADIAFVSWAGDGRTVAAIDPAGHVDVWSVYPTPHKIYSLTTGIDATYGCIALSADGSVLAAHGRAELLLAEPVTGRVRRIPTGGELIRQVAFSPDARFVLAMLKDRSVRMWAIAGAIRPLGRLRQAIGIPTVAVFSADGSVVATAERELIHLWDASATVQLAALDVQARDFTMSAAFAHRGPGFATVTNNGRVRTWNFPRDRWATSLYGLEGHVRVRYLPDGRLLSLDEPAGRGRLQIWDSAKGVALRSTAFAWLPWSEIDVSKDGHRVAFGTPDGRAAVVDVDSGRVVSILDTTGQPLNSLAFSPDGRRVAAGGDSGKIRIYSADDGVLGVTLQKGDMHFETVRFNPDGKLVLSSANGASTRLWNSSTGEVVAKLPDSISSAAVFTSDGDRLLTTGDGSEKGPRIWDTKTKKVLLELLAPGNPYIAAFSPDGELLAAGDLDGSIRFYDAANGDLLRTIEGPTETQTETVTASAVNTIDFSPDGKHLVATGVGYALIWNIELDTRTPEQVSALVAARSPWVLVDGKLVLRKP